MAGLSDHTYSKIKKKQKGMAVNMKKMLTMILSGVMALVLLTSCGGKEVTIDVNTAADTLKSNLTYAGQMNEQSGEKAMQNTYTELDASLVAAYKGYVSGDTTAEEIAVFEATDETAAAAIYETLEKYVAAQTELYAGYSPEGAQRLEKSVLKQAGKYVVLCVSNDPDNTAAEVDKILK